MRYVDSVKGQSLSQFALQYCLAYDQVTTVIPGVANIEQLLMNVKALKYPMDKKTLQWLETFYEQKVITKKIGW